jgi:hypothetical protein
VLAAVLAAAALAVLLAGRLEADGDNASTIKVEEKWQLVAGEVNPDIASPQVSTQMARHPGGTRFCNFHLNSCDIPQFSQGGLQVQVWHGTTNLAAIASDNRAVMRTPNEVITWTQYLRRDGSGLKFGIAPGAVSQTWGDFGGVEVAVPGNTNLDDYSPDYSVQNSGITYGANRVASLVLVQVRYTLANGQTRTDDTRRVVYPPASGQGN